MKVTQFVVCVLLAAMALAPRAHAVAAITANGFASPVIAPPLGSDQSDAESGSPLVRTVVSVADSLPGRWAYSASADITVPKLAILGSLDNSGGGPLTGEFGGEIALMLANASLGDTITITAPSSDPYLVTAELEIRGDLQVDGSNGTVIARIDIDPVNQLAQSRFRSFNTNQIGINENLPITFQFIGDATFDLTSRLSFFVNFVDAGATVLADFSNSAIINLTVTNLSGTVLPNVVIQSQSGSFGTAPVPVPASLPLLLAALTAVGWAARRRG